MIDIATRRRMLQFRAARRGFRELDLFMEQFTQSYLHSFGPVQLDEFEAVLDIPDQQVFDWIMGREQPPETLRSEVLDLVLAFRYAAPR